MQQLMALIPKAEPPQHAPTNRNASEETPLSRHTGKPP